MTLGIRPVGLERYLERLEDEAARRRYEAAQALEGRRWWWEADGAARALVVVAETGEADAREPGPPDYYSHTGSGPHDGSRSGGIGVVDVAGWILYTETDRRIHDREHALRKRARGRRRRRPEPRLF